MKNPAGILRSFAGEYQKRRRRSNEQERYAVRALRIVQPERADVSRRVQFNGEVCHTLLTVFVLIVFIFIAFIRRYAK
jgi:hypothetical protein